MATKLTSSNLKSVLSDVPKKGFRTKFWREYRAGACKGSGVAKALDQLEKMGVPASGDPAKADLDRMPEILDSFMSLANAMLKARGKCGKFQEESRKLCLKYSEIINNRVDEAEKLAQGGAAEIKLKKELQEQRVKEENKKTDEIIDGHKKALEEHKKLVKKEVEHCLKTMRSLKLLAEKAGPAARSAAKNIEQRLEQWTKGRNREGVDKKRLDTAMSSAIKAEVKNSKVGVYQKELVSGSKLYDKTLNTLNELDKNAIDDKTFDNATKEIEIVRKAMLEANEEIKKCSTVVSDALRVVNEAPNENVGEGKDEVQREGM